MPKQVFKARIKKYSTTHIISIDSFLIKQGLLIPGKEYKVTIEEVCK